MNKLIVSALLAGLALGLAQQMRGAHFMSHTLWSAWLCWTCCWICDMVTTQLQARRQASGANYLPDTVIPND